MEDHGSIEVDLEKKTGKLSGFDTNVLVICLVIIASCGWIGWQWNTQQEIDRNARAEFVKQHQITQKMLQSVLTSTEAIAKILTEMRSEDSVTREEIAYILTRTQKQREELNLQMPKTLRARINANR